VSLCLLFSLAQSDFLPHHFLENLLSNILSHITQNCVIIQDSRGDLIHERPKGKGSVSLTYPQATEAIRHFNLVANRCSHPISHIIGARASLTTEQLDNGVLT
jgi:hypothetical protein